MEGRLVEVASMLSGFLLVHKPVGPTSALVTAQIRRLTGIRRVGHSGTLDPGAAGLLVIALNRATALLPYLPTEKSYRAEALLGVETDTLDYQGRITATRPVPALAAAEVAAALGRFAGEILQTPPHVSAVKHEGKRLYDLARRGQRIDRPPRPVTIRAIRLLSFESPRLVFEVTCSAGTYVRVLAADLGAALGCGAHLTALTRTVSNGFPLSAALSLDDWSALAREGRWTERMLKPADALAHLPAATAPDAAIQSVLHGIELPLPPGLAGEPRPVRILDGAGDLLAVARVRDAHLAMERVMQPPAGADGEDAAGSEGSPADPREASCAS